LTEVIFSSDSQLQELNGFQRCAALCRVEVPASVEIIKGFYECDSLRELRFPRGSRIKKITELRRSFIVYEEKELFPKQNCRRIHLETVCSDDGK
jgi:hypothetical protein